MGANASGLEKGSFDGYEQFKADAGPFEVKSMAAGEYVLLFDRDCGICGAMAQWIHAVDLRRRIRLRTIQEARDLLSAIPEAERLGAFHLVGPSGRVKTGGDAVPLLIEALPMGAGLGRLLAGTSALMPRIHAAYGFLTRFRERLVCRVDFGRTSAGPGP